jgi:hypothetical protein
MTAPTSEQRNPYKGTPSRPWVRVRLVAANGAEQEIELIADTGNPYAIIISLALMQQFIRNQALGRNSNFGWLSGGWLQVRVPAIHFDQQVIGYGSDALVAAAQASHLDFAGLIRLPLLRMMEYGGDANWFWVRPAASTP